MPKLQKKVVYKMKLWSGMLSGQLDQMAEEFNSSIMIDKRLVN